MNDVICLYLYSHAIKWNWYLLACLIAYPGFRHVSMKRVWQVLTCVYKKI